MSMINLEPSASAAPHTVRDTLPMLAGWIEKMEKGGTGVARERRTNMPWLGAMAVTVVLAVTLGGAGAGADAAAKSSTGSGTAGPAAAIQRWGAGPQAAAFTDPNLPGSRVLLLREIYSDNVTYIDVGDPGASIGDYVIFQDPVVDFHTGASLGYLDVQCFVGYSDMCKGSITLAGQGQGQVEFMGANPSRVRTDRYAITGGTGIYAQVRGKIIVTFPTKDSARLALHLIGA
jgi:hypothetical protein